MYERGGLVWGGGPEVGGYVGAVLGAGDGVLVFEGAVGGGGEGLGEPVGGADEGCFCVDVLQMGGRGD